MKVQQFLSRALAADYINSRGLPLSKNTLQKYATVGGGPEYQLFGNRVVYTPAALDAWVEQKLSKPRQSTSFTG